MEQESSDIIVGLDIGTTKICAIVGRRNEHGKIEILGMGKTDSVGVARGVVQNINKTAESIKEAVKQAESSSGVEINSVYVGIAGQHIKSLQHRGLLVRQDPEKEISEDDVDKMIQDMHKLALHPGEKIIHVLPEEYIVDNEPGIKDPIGICGHRLEANFHIITGQILHVQNIYRCVRKAGLEVADLILEPLASSASALTAEEKEAGIVLVDIGGGTTDIAIFQEGIIRHTAVIPLGGNIVTEDIKEGCTLMRNQAELLKIKFGSALAIEAQENEIVSIPGLKGREPKEISVKNLAHIIQARMEEILEHVYYEIRSSGYEHKLIGGIVTSGGGAQLKHFPQLVEYITGMDARIGYPTEHIADTPIEELKKPMYATGIGLLMKGIEDSELLKYEEEELVESVSGQDNLVEKAKKRRKSKETSWFQSIINKGAKWLEDEDVHLD